MHYPQASNRSSSLMAQAPLRITRDGLAIEIDPLPPELENVFYTARLTLANGGWGSSLVRERISLLTCDPTGVPSRIWVGLEPLVRQWAKKHHLSVTPSIRVVPPLVAPQLWDSCDRRLLDRIQSSQSCLIEFDSANIDESKLIGQIISAWPAQRLAMVVKSKDQGYILAKRLRNELHINVPVHHASAQLEMSPPIVITTLPCCGDGIADLANRDFVIVVNATDLISTVGDSILREIQHRLIGFIPARSRLTPYERDMLTAIYGPESLGLPGLGERSCQVYYKFLSFYGRSFAEAAQNEASFLKQAVWYYPIRNRQICKLARLSQSNPGEFLTKLIAVPKLPPDQAKPAVYICCATDRQAELIHQKLPAAHIETARNRSFVKSIDFQRNRPSLLITTASRLATYARPDFVIRADGGQQILDLPSLWSVATNEQSSLITIVDFDDRFHRLSRQWAQLRLDAYKRSGWRELVVNSETEQLDAFIRSRPTCEI